ncbi:13514_t:CDS:2, partial [Gigaspora margarita]
MQDFYGFKNEYEKSLIELENKKKLKPISFSLFMPWGAVNDGTKTIVAKQESDIDQDDRQLWSHGWLINKQTNLCLEMESGKSPQKQK